MGDTVQTSAHDVSSGAPASLPRPTGGFGWRQLQIVAGLLAVVSFLIPMILDGKVEVFLVAMAAPFVVGLLLSRWLPRTAAVFLGLVSLAIVLTSAPFIVQALAHPEALIDFVSLVLLTLSCIVGAAAAVPAYREAATGTSRGRKARTVAVAAGAVAVVAIGISIVAASRVQEVPAQPGDVTLRTEDFVFAPAEIDAPAGSVAVHLTNTDSTRHTFTIDGITDVSVAPNSTARTTFEAAPGTYRFYCIPHAPAMDGQLVVK